MRVYSFRPAPNPTKLRIYLAEKGLAIPIEEVDLTRDEHRTPAFLAKNPLGALPVLELDDGTYLTESLPVIEYLEELHPTPPMIGTTPLERARVRRLERIADVGVLARVARIFHNTHSVLPGGAPNPAIAEHVRGELPRVLAVLDAEIGSRPFVAGDVPTIADCTLCAALHFARLGAIEIDAIHRNVHRWYEEFSSRPSARA
jgi:glutathione S-transferase